MNTIDDDPRLDSAEAYEAAGGGCPSAPCSAITAREFEVMAHALGTRGKEPGYRNHFCTGEGSDDYPTCESLVAKGLMKRHSRSWTPDYIYTVTPAGRVFVLPNDPTLPPR